MTNLARKPPPGPKVKMFVSKKWRDSARGKPCELQIPGICNYDWETTSLCHLRMFGWAGVAQKPHDFLACYACSACHDELDRRGTKARVDPWDILRALGNTLINHYSEARKW